MNIQFRHKHLRVKLEYKLLKQTQLKLINQRNNITSKKKNMSHYDIQMVSHLDKKINNIQSLIE